MTLALGTIAPRPKRGAAGAAFSAGRQLLQFFDGLGDERMLLVQFGQHYLEVEASPPVDNFCAGILFCAHWNETIFQTIFKLRVHDYWENY